MAEEPDWVSLDELAEGHIRRRAAPDDEMSAGNPRLPSHESRVVGSRGEAEAHGENPFRAPAPPKPWHVSLILEGQFDSNAVAPTEIIAPGAIDLVGTSLMTTVFSGGYEYRPSEDMELHVDALWYAEYHDRYAKFDLDSVNVAPWAQLWLTPMLAFGMKASFETSLLVAPFHHDNLLSFPAFSEDREDKVMRFTVRFERSIADHLSLYGYAMHMDNDSTLRAYMYDREMYGFGVVLYY